jgi:hypothetical protein
VSSPICGAELFIDGPVTFECDLEPGHAPPGIASSAGIIHSATDQVRHSAIDKTADGVEYQVTWAAVPEPADVSCPSCGHCMAHPDDVHEPDCQADLTSVVACAVR